MYFKTNVQTNPYNKTYLNKIDSNIIPLLKMKFYLYDKPESN